MVFGGGWCIGLAQVPLKDFIMAFGPLSITVQALFFNCFGVHWKLMILITAFVDATAALSAMRSIGLLFGKQRLWLIGLCGLLVGASFLAMFWTSWIERIAFLSCLLGIQMVCESAHVSYMRLRFLYLGIAGILSVLAFLTNQDVGVMTLTMLGALTILLALPHSRELLKSLSSFLSGVGVAAGLSAVWVAVYSHPRLLVQRFLEAAFQLGPGHISFKTLLFDPFLSHVRNAILWCYGIALVVAIQTIVLVLVNQDFRRVFLGRRAYRVAVGLTFGIPCVLMLFEMTTINQGRNVVFLSGLALSLGVGIFCLLTAGMEKLRHWIPGLASSVSAFVIFQMMYSSWNRIAYEVVPLKPANFSKGPRVQFPLKKGPSGRYLVDQDGKPFLMIADSAWGLVCLVSMKDATSYFANRQALGFNTVLISVLCGPYVEGGTECHSYDGLAPFTSGSSWENYDISTPNSAYFAHVVELVNLAAKYGLLCCLYPIETGQWLDNVINSGTSKCFNYGAYLGTIFRNCPNVIFAGGNDYNPYAVPNKQPQGDSGWAVPATDECVIAVNKGIISTWGSGCLNTVELGCGTAGYSQTFGQSASTDDANWWSILSVNWQYTYLPTYETAKVYYQNTSIPVIPNILGEAGYEGEVNGTVINTPVVCRRQNWCSIVYGNSGFFFGTHYLFRSGWQSNLNTAGAVQCGYLAALYNTFDWWTLVPDFNHKLVISGYGKEFTNLRSPSTTNGSGQPYIAIDNYVPAALASDGSFGLAYIQQTATITVVLSRFRGPVTARWYDPSNNSYWTIGTYSNLGTHKFTSPSFNRAGDEDFVLLLTTKDRSATVKP